MSLIHTVLLHKTLNPEAMRRRFEAEKAALIAEATAAFLQLPEDVARRAITYGAPSAERFNAVLRRLMALYENFDGEMNGVRTLCEALNPQARRLAEEWDMLTRRPGFDTFVRPSIGKAAIPKREARRPTEGMVLVFNGALVCVVRPERDGFAWIKLSASDDNWDFYRAHCNELAFDY